MKMTRDALLGKELRAHSLLADVRLHDVWAFQLQGGGPGRTLVDFQALMSSESMQKVNPIVNALFRLRLGLGRRLGWDDDTYRTPGSSYIHRLTAADRTRSLEEPGSLPRISGPLSMRWPPVVYTFGNEALYEIINFTGHCFLLMTMEAAEHGYTVIWAIYVKNVSWVTPLYMKLIDPFRQAFVYPGLIAKMERAWAANYEGLPGGPFNPAAPPTLNP